MYALIVLVLTAGNIDSNQGTLKASQGAIQRTLEPSYYDAFFPVFAFVMVIITPLIIAFWVIYKTWSKK